MRVIDDFLCPSGHEHEHLVPQGTTAIECIVCGAWAAKVRSVPNFTLEGVSGDFPTAADRWVSDRAKRLKNEEKAIERHGDE